MCFFSQPSTPDPVIATPAAAAKMPDYDTAGQAGEAQRRRIRAGGNTILTSGSGVTTPAPTNKKTLLGA